MPKRTGWSGLSASQRKRLEGAGRSGKLAGAPLSPAQTRAYWQSGADLRAGYGKPPKPPRGAAPVGPSERFGVNLPVGDDYERIVAWQRSGDVPAWIRDYDGPLGFDTAAQLSQLPSPKSWRHVQFDTTGDGLTMMTVKFKGRAYPKTIYLPSIEALSETGALLEQLDYPGLAVDHDGEGS